MSNENKIYVNSSGLAQHLIATHMKKKERNMHKYRGIASPISNIKHILRVIF